jgi:membrane associated rhomboid family serine protease
MEPRVLRVTRDESLAEEWHLCLTAEGVAHHIEPVDGQLALVVDERDLARADEMLLEYDEERRERALERVPARPPDAPSAFGMVAAVALVAFHFAGLAYRAELFAAGRASAADIVHGQLWRCLTALTLHADYMHVAGNAVAALIFFTALGRWVGGGVASIGASTATFAGLGLLVALQLRRRRQATRRERFWLPVAAALGLFAMLGVGGGEDHHIDVLSHVFGLLSGGAVGALIPMRGRASTRWQLLSGAVAVALLVGAWGAALAHARGG